MKMRGVYYILLYRIELLNLFDFTMNLIENFNILQDMLIKKGKLCDISKFAKN